MPDDPPPSTGAVPFANPSHPGASKRRRWAVTTVLATVAFVLLLWRWDVVLMRWRYDLMPANPSRTLDQFLAALRDFGQTLSAVIALCIVAAYDARRKTIILALLLAEAFSAAAYNAGKYTIARHRPYDAVAHVAPLDEISPAQTWIGWRPGNDAFDTRSFPSGHSAAAFALAGVLACFYPRLRWMFWTLATACAASRVIDAVHWPSDCLAGALIGLVASNFAIAGCHWVLVTQCRGRVEILNFHEDEHCGSIPEDEDASGPSQAHQARRCPGRSA